MSDRIEGVNSRSTIAIGAIIIVIIAVIVAVVLLMTSAGIGVGGEDNTQRTVEPQDAGVQGETLADPDIGTEADDSAAPDTENNSSP
jgi:hypothetical protein